MVSFRNNFLFLLFLFSLKSELNAGTVFHDSYHDYQEYVLPKQMTAALRKGLKATNLHKSKRKAILEYITKEEKTPSLISFLSSGEYAQVQEMRALFWEMHHVQPLSTRVMNSHLLANCTESLKKAGMKKKLMSLLKCMYLSKAAAGNPNGLP